MLHLLAFIIAVAPAGALLWYIRHLDRYEPEPWTLLFRLFVAGALSAVPAFFVEAFLGSIGPTTGFIATVYSAFIIAGLTEESAKGLFAWLAIRGRREFNEVMDGIVYFGVAHMGFAVAENMLYVFVGGDIYQGLLTAMVRTTTAVPMHVVVGMIMGYHVGVARFARRRQDRMVHLAEGWILPVLLHGFYNLGSLNQEMAVDALIDLLRYGFGSALLYAAVVALWLILLPRVRKAQQSSPFRPIASIQLAAAETPCPHCGAVYPEGGNYCSNCGESVS
ncbi:MAG: PrsW family glutamic-type intramembrane protease [Bacillota bacterium]